MRVSYSDLLVFRLRPKGDCVNGNGRAVAGGPRVMPHPHVLDWHRRLIRLRRSFPALLDGDRARVRVDCDEDARWLRMDRGPITVVCNFGRGATTVPLGDGGGRAVLLAAGSHAVSARMLELGPGAVILGTAEAASLWERSGAR